MTEAERYAGVHTRLTKPEQRCFLEFVFTRARNLQHYGDHGVIMTAGELAEIIEDAFIELEEAKQGL